LQKSPENAEQQQLQNSVKPEADRADRPTVSSWLKNAAFISTVRISFSTPSCVRLSLIPTAVL